MVQDDENVVQDDEKVVQDDENVVRKAGYFEGAKRLKNLLALQKDSSLSPHHFGAKFRLE